NKALSCLVDDSDQSAASGAVQANTTKKLPPGSAQNSWNISCERVGQQNASGGLVYPAVDFTVTTSKGTLSMPIAKDAAIPYQYASEIKSELDGVNSRIKTQEDRRYTIVWDTSIPGSIGGDDADLINVPIPNKHDICEVSETAYHSVGAKFKTEFNVIN